MTITNRIESYTLAHAADLYIFDCAACGIVFGIPTAMEKRRRRDGQPFYCPNGHSMAWHEDDSDRLRKAKRDLVLQQQQLDQERARADHMAAVARGHKGAHQRTKNRIAKGVCPCCNRSFADLARHMAGQHPDYVETKP